MSYLFIYFYYATFRNIPPGSKSHAGRQEVCTLCCVVLRRLLKSYGIHPRCWQSTGVLDCYRELIILIALKTPPPTPPKKIPQHLCSFAFKCIITATTLAAQDSCLCSHGKRPNIKSGSESFLWAKYGRDTRGVGPR